MSAKYVEGYVQIIQHAMTANHNHITHLRGRKNPRSCHLTECFYYLDYIIAQLQITLSLL